MTGLILQDPADLTKQLDFDLSAITTGTKRTITVPDASGTLSLAPSGGAVGGAGSLLTAGAAAIVASSGMLGQAAALREVSNSVGVGPSNVSPTGTLHIYNATPTTGVTTQTIRAGAGQGSTALMEWYANNGSTLLARIGSGGAVSSGKFDDAGIQNSFILDTSENGLKFKSDKGVFWSSGAIGSTPDTAIRRTSAGLLAIDNGTPGSYIDVQLRNLVQALTTPASAGATGVAGTITADADYVYVCTATDTWKRVAISTWP